MACTYAARRNAEMRAVVAGDVTLLTPAIGSIAPPIAGTGRSGADRIIGYARETRPTLVYTFSRNCGWCQRNWSQMRALQSIAPWRIRMVYIDTEDNLPSDYLGATGIGNSEVLTSLYPQADLAYRALLLPQLELLDRRGRVQWSHAGLLASSDISTVTALVAADQEHKKGGGGS